MSATAIAKPGKGTRVLTVQPRSLADQLGIHAGDVLLSINGHPVNDLIDYWFHVAADELVVEWIGQTSTRKRRRTIRKPFHERLGIELEPFEIRRCSNACVFCFVHQLPQGMRRELYVKDEDYRLSFLYGNYITGTNLTPEDKARIKEMRLSPLFFSIHATSQELRERLLVKKNIEPIIPLLADFIESGISINAQIVLCPGWNDGVELEKTVADLASLYPGVESAAVVPIGLTEHRGRLPQMETITQEYALQAIEHIRSIQQHSIQSVGYPMVFPSDEFFLIAGITPPAYDEYPEIPQLANGVGMYYRFYQYLDELIDQLPVRLSAPSKVGVLTSILGQKVIQRLIDRINDRVDGLTLECIVITNTLFGPGITVTGLLPGCDFQTAIEQNPSYDAFMIPQNALRSWDSKFIDDMPLESLRSQVDKPLIIAADTTESFITELFGHLLKI